MHQKEISFHNAISTTLKLKEKCHFFNDALLVQDRTKVRHRNENEYWDYKQHCNLRDKREAAKLAKHVLAFHNNKGGCLIYGVRDDFVVCGIAEESVLDTNGLRGALRKYIGDIEVFQDSVPSPTPGNVVWVIFVPPRNDAPVSVKANAPDNTFGKALFKKGDYFLRVGDETRLVQGSHDLERLFHGVSFAHLSAYDYDIDEPYYLLLSPHHDVLIGRHELKDKIVSALGGRSYIVSLDGVGGVGKSALAIEVVKELYESGQYDFIVSLSAKLRIWQEKSSSRKPNFVGLSDLLREMSRVLLPGESWTSTDEMKKDVIRIMTGAKGLLFVDNLETINDDNVIQFLKEIPAPVKIVITSKIRRGELPAEEIFIPELSIEEGRILFSHELSRLGGISRTVNTDEIDGIVGAAGRLPLAIKWLASITHNNNSTFEAAAIVKKEGVQRNEFLGYCFSEMVDGLSDLARYCAYLCPYLPAECWNASMLAVSLGEDPIEIENAMEELEKRGLVIRGSDVSKRFVLPLTMDFLNQKLKKQRQFRQNVDKRLSDAIPEAVDQFYAMSPKRKASILYEGAKSHVEQGELDSAKTKLGLAIQFLQEERSELLVKCSCLQARLRARSGQHQAAIDQMRTTLDPLESLHGFESDLLWLGGKLLQFGGLRERRAGIDTVERAIANGAKEPLDAVELYCEHAVAKKEYEKGLAGTIRACREGCIAKILLLNTQTLLSDSAFTYLIGGTALRRTVQLALDACSTDEDTGWLKELSRLAKLVPN